MEFRNSPTTITTKRRVKYRKSSWRVHEFEVWNGEMVCRVAALRMNDSVFVWVGGREPQLCELALGMPQAARDALATTLLGAAGSAASLARRLSAALGRPAHVACGQAFDRFTAPLVERAIAKEIKSHPEYF